MLEHEQLSIPGESFKKIGKIAAVASEAIYLSANKLAVIVNSCGGIIYYYEPYLNECLVAGIKNF